MAVMPRTRPAPSAISAAVRAFDRLAPHYDELCGGELFRTMRDAVRRIVQASLEPGMRVLEIGCGSGIDTAWLASLGVEVFATDPSAGMLERTRARVTAARRGDAVRLLCCGLEHLEAHLGPSCRFDAIVSNFGALNCVPDLQPLGRLAAERLRPGGRALVCLLSRTCLWEIGWFLLKADRARAFRRLQPPPVMVNVAGIPVPTFYHRVSDVARVARPSLSVGRIVGCGVLTPPPYLERRWLSLPRVVRRAAAAADSTIGRFAPFSRLGDHVLVELAKP